MEKIKINIQTWRIKTLSTGTPGRTWKKLTEVITLTACTTSRPRACRDSSRATRNHSITFACFSPAENDESGWRFNVESTRSQRMLHGLRVRTACKTSCERAATRKLTELSNAHAPPTRVIQYRFFSRSRENKFGSRIYAFTSILSSFLPRTVDAMVFGDVCRRRRSSGRENKPSNYFQFKTRAPAFGRGN